MASHTSLHPLILYKGKVGGNESRRFCCFPIRLEPTQNANPTKMMQIRHKSYTNPTQIPCKSRATHVQTPRKPHTHRAAGTKMPSMSLKNICAGTKMLRMSFKKVLLATRSRLIQAGSSVSNTFDQSRGWGKGRDRA